MDGTPLPSFKFVCLSEPPPLLRADLARAPYGEDLRPLVLGLPLAWVDDALADFVRRPCAPMPPIVVALLPCFKAPEAT